MRLLRQSLAARDVRGGPSLSVTSSPGESVAPYSPGTIRGAVVVRLESLHYRLANQAVCKAHTSEIKKG
jgi:hypothetical protein